MADNHKYITTKVKDIFKLYRGEVRVYNLAYNSTVSITNTKYFDWAKLDFLWCDVKFLAVELRNTAQISTRLIIFVDDVDISDNYDECKDNEATDEEIAEIISDLYSDTTSESQSKSQSESERQSEILSISTSMSESLSIATSEVASMEESQYNSMSEANIPEATDDDIEDLIGGLYN